MPLRLADDRPPIPPADLILRVVPPFEAENMEGARQGFDLGALNHLSYFERGLAGVGRSFEDFDRLLDFGCGCGRFVRHFGQLADEVEIHGTDIDAEMIGWLQANVPYGHFELAPHEPPLPYADHYFDLVINHSVFTHLDERHQDLWLAELQRVTRPGAFLLLTVEGQSSWSRTCGASEQAGESSQRWRDELESRGILFIPDDQFLGSTHPDFYHSTVHAPWYIFEHWTRFFDLAAYLPDGSLSQDLVVMRRRPDGAPHTRAIGHRMRQSSAEPPDSAPRSFGRRVEEMLTTLRRVASRRSPRGAASRRRELDPEAMQREINMLRVGLYEQGKRTSVLAALLREEIAAVRRPDD